MTGKVVTKRKAVKPSKVEKASTSVKPSKPAKPSTLRLLPGEKVQLKDGEETKETTDEELNSRYVTGEVRIVTESARYSLAGILSMLQETVGPEKHPRYKLDPEYQRRHRWSRERKSRLIESFLMNIPVPPVFLYEREYAQFEVMDGRQRLTALAEFYSGKFPLEGLQYWKELHGRFYATLPSKVRDGIDRRYISSIILLKETATNEDQAAQLKKLVFERLNSGGVALSHQETRNAVYQGQLNSLCLEMSDNEAFRNMWGIPEKPRENSGDPDLTRGEEMFQNMDDVEIVLRFFAYRHISERGLGLNNISMVLDRFLAEGNKFPDEVLREYRNIFEATTSLLWEILNESAFCPIASNEKAKERPTKIVYDPLMWVASRYAAGGQRAALLKNPTVLRERLAAMYEKHGESFAGRKTNSTDVKVRNQYMEEAFADVIATIGA